jgi:membrane-associated phospholipid phosphatase
MTANSKLVIRTQDDRSQNEIVEGLRAPGLLAKWPGIGLFMFIFGSLMFGGLTYNLYAHGPLLVWDKALANTLPAIGLKSPAFVKGLMNVGFYMGKEVVTGLTILFSLYFLYKRYWQEFAMMTIGWLGSAVLFNAFSRFIGRERPLTQIWIIVHLPGFPSGHAVAVVTFYGLLAYLLAPKIHSAFGKIVVVLIAILIIGFVGFSRIFTGGHYLTDILSGYAVGIAWSGAVYTLIELYYKRKRNLSVDKG